jgi:hypothetical protein
MEVNMRRALLGLICVLTGTITLTLEPQRANAGGYYYDDDRPDPAPRYYTPRPYYQPPAYYAVPAPYYARPVYQYVPPPVVYYPPPEDIRPTSCGRYRYWNGEYCADARRERPYLGPRW